ncbi:MAG: hypothetical protein M8860_02250 [marine benthic group bacterium]|jgi:hypothetical protein|nr:hypothetical protein [Gemmatimonadota bacterium]MCL7961658.1 hypothetical protein [Candidatus Carthagonibacter metallireducens]MCL7938324.1 hypothetical protein [Gemmatimonadota bacterium]MCL7957070.1 hypothetical protein [Gemmatimonadota bacterium]MCL7964539.1 hypothetical protein [Gemmatimonadota bacterium]
MTKHFRDDDGRRWKAWLASRDVFWPDPDDKRKVEDREAVIFVCFSDPSEPQRRIRLPAGSFETLSTDDLVSQFEKAEADPAIR